MYSTVFKSDPLDPARGDRYRRSILLPGGSREELDSLEVKEGILSIDTRLISISRSSSDDLQIRMHFWRKYSGVRR
jgi:hypothetical protein